MADSLDPDGLWRPFGAFSQLVVSGPGRLIFLKGQVALDAAGDVVGPGDMTRNCALS